MQKFAGNEEIFRLSVFGRSSFDLCCEIEEWRIERERERKTEIKISNEMHRDASLRVFVTPEYRWNVATRPPHFSLSSRLRSPHATPRGFGCIRLSKGQECNARAADSLSSRRTQACAPTCATWTRKWGMCKARGYRKMDILSANPGFSTIFLETFRAPFSSLLPRKLMRLRKRGVRVPVSIF